MFLKAVLKTVFKCFWKRFSKDFLKPFSNVSEFSPSGVIKFTWIVSNCINYQLIISTFSVKQYYRPVVPESPPQGRWSERGCFSFAVRFMNNNYRFQKFRSSTLMSYVFNNICDVNKITVCFETSCYVVFNLVINYRFQKFNVHVLSPF